MDLKPNKEQQCDQLVQTAPGDTGATVPLEVTVEALLDAKSETELETLLSNAAINAGYDGHLPVAWQYWHYGRHAEFAEELGKPELANLFRVAWDVQNDVFGVAASEVDAAKDKVRQAAAARACTNQFSCYVLVSGTPSDPEDEDVPGLYEVSVSTSEPVNLGALNPLQISQIVAAVKDAFHDHIGIEVLDDFSIDCCLPTGKVIDDDEEAMVDESSFSAEADFEGSVDWVQLPAAVQASMEEGDPDVDLLDVEFYIDAAQQHGEDDDPDHEVGDLQDMMRALWPLLTSWQRLAFASSSAVINVVEAALPGEADVLEEVRSALPMDFNSCQRAILDGYEQGFHLVTGPESVATCGDGLLQFLLTELSDREDCTSIDEAKQRISSVIRHLQQLEAALDQ